MLIAPEKEARELANIEPPGARRSFKSKQF